MYGPWVLNVRGISAGFHRSLSAGARHLDTSNQPSTRINPARGQSDPCMPNYQKAVTAHL